MVINCIHLNAVAFSGLNNLSIIKTYQYSPTITIIGAGPAGTSTSLFLSKEKIPHLIIDKAVFPRDKICGDALSGKVVEIFNKLDRTIVPEIASDAARNTGSWGVKFVAPNGKSLDLHLRLLPAV